jgi:hypothetical protein
LGIRRKGCPAVYRMATGYTLCGRGAAWATTNLGPEGLRVASRTACSPRGLRTTAWVPHGTLSRSELVRREGDACEGRGHGGTDCAGVLLVGPERVVGQWRAERPSVGCYTRPQSTDPGLVSQSAETRWQRVCDNGVTTACAAVSECVVLKYRLPYTNRTVGAFVQQRIYGVLL